MKCLFLDLICHLNSQPHLSYCNCCLLAKQIAMKPSQPKPKPPTQKGPTKSESK